MRRQLWLFVALALLATVLGAYLSRADALRYDERWTLYNAGGLPYEPLALGGVWQRIADDDPWQSPGYFLALNMWGGAAGWSVYAGRMFSLLTGIAALAWIVRLGSALANRRVGVYAACALLGSAFFAYYLHEMRPYTLYVLFTCMSVWAYWRVTTAGAGRATYALLFFALVGLAYTHPLALLSALALGAYHVLFVRQALARWSLTLGVMALAGALFIPWLLVLLRAVDIARADVTRQAVALTSSEILAQVLYAFSSGSLALFAFIAAFSLRDRPQVKLVILWIVVGLFAALLVNLWLPVFVHIRYLMALWPAFALLFAFGVESLRERGIPAIVPLGIWLVAGLLAALSPEFFASLKNSERTLPAVGLEHISHTIRAYSQPDEAALFHTRPPGLEWQNLGVIDVYLWGAPLKFTDIETLNPDTEASERDYIRSMRAYLTGVQGLWTAIMPEVPHTSRQRAFFTALTQDFGACEYPNAVGGIVTQYFARLTPLDDGTPFAFSTPDGQIIGAEVLRYSRSDDAIRLALGSTAASGVAPGRYAAFVHLLDSSGTVVSQGDVSVGDAARLCSLSVVSLTGLPGGTYSLAFGLYDRTTLNRLTGSDGSASADRFELSSVTISSP